MPLTLVLGALYGDEGKGRIVHLLSRDAKICARFNGGGNASHTVLVDGEKITLRQIPCGILWPKTTAITGDGMLVNPIDLVSEIDDLAMRGIKIGPRRLRISPHAHVVLPWHRLLDEFLEESRGTRALGTTRQGIGPAMSTKVMRTGIRVGDLFVRSVLKDRLSLLEDELLGRSFAAHRSFATHRRAGTTRKAVLRSLDAVIHRLEPYVGGARRALLDALAKDQRVLVEGAQGVLLDVDHGAWPHVTATHPTTGGALASLGLPASAVGEVIGVTRAYCTRQAKGFFPTEVSLNDERVFRHATRDHALRVGWLDCVMLRYAHSICGFTELVVTGLDRVANVPRLKLCIGYRGIREIDRVPPSAEPIYRELPGFSADISSVSRYKDLPLAVRRLLDEIEHQVGVPIRRVSCRREGPLVER